MRYLSQRYAMPYREVAGLLTDIGTEELAHMEMICAMVRQLTQDLTPEEIQKSGFDTYYVDHTLGLWPAAASGIPHNACEYSQKAIRLQIFSKIWLLNRKQRATYDNILRLVKDPEVCDPIRFLREREVVHFQRFGEGLRLVTDRLKFQKLLCVQPGF